MVLWSCPFRPDKYLFNRYFLRIYCTVGSDARVNIVLSDMASTVFLCLELLLFDGGADVQHIRTGRMEGRCYGIHGRVVLSTVDF